MKILSRRFVRPRTFGPPTGFLLTTRPTDIQAKKQRQGIFWTLQGHSGQVYQSAQKAGAEQIPKKPTISIANSPGLSTLRQTPQNNSRRAGSPQFCQDGNGASVRNHPTTNLAPLLLSNRRPSGSHGKSEINDTADVRLRRYRLSHNSLPSLKRQPSSTGGITKRRKPQRDNLAVFVETQRGETLLERTIRNHGHPGQGESEELKSQDRMSLIDQNGPTQKRPKVNATERAWRSETWGNQNASDAKSDSEARNQPATNWDDASIQLAQELQRFALEQSQAQPSHISTSNIKFKPKPPVPRQATGNAKDVKILSDPVVLSVADEDGDYIVDTYIRAPLQSLDMDAAAGTYVDPLHDVDRHKIGILVIDEEQELLWETFGDEHQSEPEVESDEEDENGSLLTAIPKVWNANFTSRGLLW